MQGHLFLSTLDWAAVEEKSGEAPYKPEAPAPVNTDDRTWCDGVPGEIQPAAAAQGAGGGGGGGGRARGEGGRGGDRQPGLQCERTLPFLHDARSP